MQLQLHGEQQHQISLHRENILKTIRIKSTGLENFPFPLKHLNLFSLHNSFLVMWAGQLDGIVGVEGSALVGQLGLELRRQAEKGVVLN